MSEVWNNPTKIAFPNLVRESKHVVVVKNLRRQVIVFQTTLTKETGSRNA